MKNSPSEKTSASNPLDHFDHVVVLMLENRSFDNLLGYLYKPEDIKPDFPLGKKFAGLHFDGPHGNPVPEDTINTAKKAMDYLDSFEDKLPGANKAELRYIP